MGTLGALLGLSMWIGSILLPAVEKNANELCLALNVYYESGSEITSGKEAVAHVTMARLKDNLREFGGPDVCGVVFHKTNRPTDGEKVAEFSWTTRKLRLPKPSPAWENAQRIANLAIRGLLSVPPELKDARYFMNERIAGPGGKCFFRGLVRIATIGNHDFYRKPHTMPEAVVTQRLQERCLENTPPQKKIVVAKKEKKKRTHFAAKKGKHTKVAAKKSKHNKVAAKKSKKNKKYASKSSKKKTRKT